jgi:hypothetical protein
MEREYYRIIYPEHLSREAVEGFVYSLKGIMDRPLHDIFAYRKAVIFEVWGDWQQIHHRIGVPTGGEHIVSQMRSHMHGINIVPDADTVFPDLDYVGEFGFSSTITPLDAGDPKRVATNILNTLQPLEYGDIAVVQWVLAPTNKSAPTRKSMPEYHKSTMSHHKGDHMLWASYKAVNNYTSSLNERLQASAKSRFENHENWKQSQTQGKWQGPMFNAICRIGVSSPNGNAETIYTRLVDGLESTSGLVHFVPFGFNSASTANRKLLNREAPKIRWSSLLNGYEVGAILAFPFESLNVPGLKLGGSVQMPPSSDIPTDGRVIAYSSYTGTKRPLAIPWPETLRHFYILGKSGVGKSTVLERCAIQDMERGAGLLYIDPIGESAKRLIDYVPANRIKDVIYFDPASPDGVVGLNPFETGGVDPDITASNFVAMIRNLYRDSWGDRMQTYLTVAAQTLALVQDATMLDVIDILSNPQFRWKVLSMYPPSYALMASWKRYERLTDSEQREHIAPLLTRLDQFNIEPKIRHVIGQAHPAINMAKVIAENKIIIANLNKGNLPGQTHQLFGATLTSMLWEAILRRDTYDDTPAFSLYVDEFHDFLESPNKLNEMFAQARGKKLAITVANQFLWQLKNSVTREDFTHSVLANANSAMYFNLTDDADTISNLYRANLTASDFQGLGQTEVIVSISTGTLVRSKPVVATTYPLPEKSPHSSAAVLEHSNSTYAMPRQMVDDILMQRREEFTNEHKRGSRRA